ncbi:MAG: hypothetical protein A2086_04395 [Spirochaetes bacterium GWD1_27_9]|nr:MAG: hypothetical protein A2Z98_12160 [Spirochaetes bacterium GWB1_27_13]OHD26007.1 MAG: hypothetical protein A2Y34_00680 [Spirochaetes bacterium GWC1_27_15]OHD32326.1 MAG: hypothetical protein A2086_04395 [Spirochaetes bacterium GWD1_27_9]
MRKILTFFFIIFNFTLFCETNSILPPYFNPPAGTYDATQDITIKTDTDGAMIYYTIDGTTPSIDNFFGKGVGLVSIKNMNKPITAIAIKNGVDESSVSYSYYYLPFELENKLSEIFIKNNSFNLTLQEDRFLNKEQTYYFDGLKDYIKLKNDFDVIKDGSISLWVKFNSLANKTDPLKIFYEIASSDAGMMNKDNDWGLALYLDNYNGVSFGLNNLKDGSNFLGTGFFPMLNKWYNITATWGSSGMKLYINDKLIGEKPYIGSYDELHDKILIGAGTYPKSFFNGNIDDVQIYNYSLNEKQTAFLYNKNKLITKNYDIDLIASFLTGNFDYKKNENLKTNPSLIKDKFTDSTFKFDGVDDYISIPNNLNGVAEGTISLWVKFGDYPFDIEPLKIFYEIATGLPSSNSNWGFALFLDYNQGLRYILNSQSGSYGINTSFFPLLNKWYYIVATWGSDGMKLYVNGKLKGSNKFTGTYLNSFDKIMFGTGTYPKSYFTGNISDVKIYGRIFDSSDVEYFYKNAINAYNRKKQIKINKKKSTQNNIINKDNIQTDLNLKISNYKKSMIISGAITGSLGLTFLGLTPLFFNLGDYYKSHYNLIYPLYQEAKTSSEIEHYYNVLKSYSTLSNVLYGFGIPLIPLGISLSVTSFFLFIFSNYYLKNDKAIKVDLGLQNNNINFSLGIKL